MTPAPVPESTKRTVDTVRLHERDAFCLFGQRVIYLGRNPAEVLWFRVGRGSTLQVIGSDFEAWWQSGKLTRWKHRERMR